MYLIAVYDVNKDRVNKVKKIFRKFLFHVQNSVFEGELSNKQFDKLCEELEHVIEYNDNVKIYIISTRKVIKTVQMGSIVKVGNIII